MIQRWLEIQLPLIKSLIIHDFSTTKPTSPDPKTSKATRVLSVQTIQQEALTMIASKVNWSRRSTRQLAVSPHQCFQSQASCAIGSSMFRAKVTKPSWCYWVCIITITSSIAKLLAKQTNIPQIFCTMNLKGTGQDWALYSTTLSKLSTQSSAPIQKHCWPDLEAQSAVGELCFGFLSASLERPRWYSHCSQFWFLWNFCNHLSRYFKKWRTVSKLSIRTRGPMISGIKYIKLVNK